MKILHTADIHLSKYEDDRWRALQRIIKIGKEEEVEIFVVSGDLFDSGIDAENLRPKLREIFSNNGFQIILIPGNHDADSYESGLHFGDEVSIITDFKKPFKYKDLKIWGLPFEFIGKEEILNKLHLLAKDLPNDKVNILLYHGELLDTYFSRKDFGEEGEGRYMPVRLSYFKELNVKYVLAGHFHSNFHIRNLENGGYFVYPGSPISITKRETGQRKVNIFEVGTPPKEFPLDTPYFEEVNITFDPFEEKNPVEKAKEHFESLRPEAKIILTIRGYINSERIKMGESELVKQIREITKNKVVEELHPKFRDIHTIFDDDLFKRFLKKLDQGDYGEEKK